MRPKLITGLLVGATLALTVGTAVAATRPTWKAPAAHMAAVGSGHATATTAATIPPISSRTSALTPAPVPPLSTTSLDPPSTAPPATAPATTAAPAPTAISTVTTPTVLPAITYTVKAGDTLSGIAQWFSLHGYEALYQENAAVIGANPNLIFPGQHITIAHGVMTFSSAR